MDDFAQLAPAHFVSHALSTQDVYFLALSLVTVGVLLLLTTRLPITCTRELRTNSLLWYGQFVRGEIDRVSVELIVARRPLKSSRHRLEQNMLLHVRKRNTAESPVSLRRLESAEIEFGKSLRSMTNGLSRLEEEANLIADLMIASNRLANELSAITNANERQQKLCETMREEHRSLALLAWSVYYKMKDVRTLIDDSKKDMEYVGDQSDADWLKARFVQLRSRLGVEQHAAVRNRFPHAIAHA